jgi:DNA-binding response OmpR family regulator
MATILIIDDDPDLCVLVGTILAKTGYEVEAAYDGRSGLEKAAELQPDLILLDIMMPDKNGWEVGEELREVCGAPVIFLSARGGERDVVRGLQLGADDYISKPFRHHELVARIEAVLRRAGTAPKETVYQIGDLTIDRPRWEVRRGDELIHLTPTEFKLLLLLAQHAGRPVTHKDILTEVWGGKHEHNLNLLKVYIRQLRQKIEQNPDRPQYLLTKRGVGYRIATDV